MGVVHWLVLGGAKTRKRKKIKKKNNGIPVHRICVKSVKIRILKGENRIVTNPVPVYGIG